jgi:hypothetical protein
MLELIRGGHVRRGLELASDASAVHIAATAEAAGAELVGDWWQAHEAGREAIMLAHRREKVRDLNVAGRALMDQAGRLGHERLVLAGGEFAVGDEVLLRRRSPTAQVNNGSRGRIEAIDPDHEQVTLRLSDDRQVTLDADYLRQPA